MKKIVFYLLFTLYLSANELSFIAFDNENWQIVHCKEQKCKIIKSEQEPRTYDYDFDSGSIVYVASDKSVRTIIDGKEQIVLTSQKDAYTQPLFIENGKKIMLVKLINGNSKKTEIISMDLFGKNHKMLHYQYSTALEPYSQDGKKIYYANVSCVEGCGHIIQEIWEKDITSGQAKQITMLNALSHQPNVDSEGKYLYFSSNEKGDYHIYRVSLEDYSVKQLTFGNVTDGFPVASKDGLYFIRRENSKIEIVRVDKDLELKTLSYNYKKIRNLKVKQ
ncbi:hypothetical protein MNB_SV-13-2098 [hydrothermal vent metagenome]|uniref:TolB protein, periplasmic protein involved in the tonb-independent uptake of group A colicins n=1 Tax=hydrothermal vent metagenome TaxID=652676 RepID=A0A1W1CEQ3_9ZZZZ